MDSGDGEESWEWSDRENDSSGDEDGGDERGGGIGDGGGSGGGGPLARVRWFMRTDEEWVVFVREVASSVGVVVLIGLLLFAVSGLWPPLVAVESGSMSPHLQKGDLVFVMEEHRFAGAAAHDGTGVVTFRAGAKSGYKKFHEYGNVIVYHPDGDDRATPVIHRARFWVNKGENWYGEANRAYVGSAENCEELANCPAPHAGFITKGDHNDAYDQVGGLYGTPISSPVEPSWVVGAAEFRIPWLGRIRLLFGMVNADPTAITANATPAAGNATATTGNTAVANPTAPPTPSPMTGASAGGPLGGAGAMAVSG